MKINPNFKDRWLSKFEKLLSMMTNWGVKIRYEQFLFTLYSMKKRVKAFNERFVVCIGNFTWKIFLNS